MLFGDWSTPICTDPDFVAGAVFECKAWGIGSVKADPDTLTEFLGQGAMGALDGEHHHRFWYVVPDTAVVEDGELVGGPRQIAWAGGATVPHSLRLLVNQLHSVEDVLKKVFADGTGQHALVDGAGRMVDGGQLFAVEPKTGVVRGFIALARDTSINEQPLLPVMGWDAKAGEFVAVYHPLSHFHYQLKYISYPSLG
ncbi:MAG: hypothetical protein Q6373_023140 [Candidatus Sigynarchaeota archaeon]